MPGINAKNLMLGLDPAHTSHEKIHSNTSAVANGNQRQMNGNSVSKSQTDSGMHALHV